MTRIVALTLASLIAVACTKAPAFEVTNAWVRRPPPGQEMTAAYFELRYNGDVEELKLVDVSSPNFGRVEMHTTILDNGIARMRALPHVRISGKKPLQFAPGGMHLMLFAPNSSFDELQKVELTFHFDQHEAVNICVPVGDGADLPVPECED